eukprot:TRINITY_DN2418_c0_g1_i1.p1 TRINITY_DN2418_c0_g1~~TRINITY_DN2418_c0_g1_i1.p1  ORF type:complete len:615 (-),score=164.04 TRINITY_DN2418_c0_g1_i1:113-1957(-)
MRSGSPTGDSFLGDSPAKVNGEAEQPILTGRNALQVVGKKDGSWNWTFVGPDPESLPLAGGGNGGIAEMRACLEEQEDATLYGLLRMYFGTGRMMRAKWVLIAASVDDGAPNEASRMTTVRRGQAVGQRPAMETAFRQFAHFVAVVEITDSDDLNPDHLIQRMRSDLADDDVISRDAFAAAEAQFGRTYSTPPESRKKKKKTKELADAEADGKLLEAGEPQKQEESAADALDPVAEEGTAKVDHAEEEEEIPLEKALATPIVETVDPEVLRTRTESEHTTAENGRTSVRTSAVEPELAVVQEAVAEDAQPEREAVAEDAQPEKEAVADEVGETAAGEAAEGPAAEPDAAPAEQPAATEVAQEPKDQPQSITESSSNDADVAAPVQGGYNAAEAAPPQPLRVQIQALFEEGAHVDVWSASMKAWIEDGTVVAVLRDAGVRDGISLESGSLKVIYQAGTKAKWLTVEQQKEMLRKTLGAATARLPEPLTGPLLKETHNWFSEWHVRFFVLKDGTLQWWKSQEDCYRRKPPSTSLLLTGLQLNLISGSSKFLVKTNTSKGVVYTLDANEAKQPIEMCETGRKSVHQWVNALQAHGDFAEARAREQSLQRQKTVAVPR